MRDAPDSCRPCLEKYGLEAAVKKLVKRCCGHDDVPSDLLAAYLLAQLEKKEQVA